MDETRVDNLNGKVIMTNKYRLAKTKDGEFVLQQYYEYYNSNDGYWSTLDTELLEE